MNKIKCELIQDLLPLYVDEVCSEESRKTVAEHVSECGECRNKLEKMVKTFPVGMENDIAVVKHIKRRIRIEQFVTAAVVTIILVIAAWAGYNFLVNTACSMDYEKYNIAENVRVEEDNDGKLWIVASAEASTAWSVFPTQSDENGNYLGYDDNFDRDKANGYGITLKHRRFNEFTDFEMFAGFEKRTQISEALLEYDNIEKIFYYDVENV